VLAGAPNQVVRASASPRSVRSPTQATWPSGRISTALHHADRHRRPQRGEFSPLSEQAFGSGHRLSIPAGKEREQCVLRMKALEEWGSAWRRVSSRTREPYIVTMARGKTGDLGPLREFGVAMARGDHRTKSSA
jgi:hypothetical protein